MEFNTRAFITEAETLALIRYVKNATKDIVEVGTYLGGTAENIAPHIPRGLALWSIDIFGGFSGGMNPATIYHEHLVDFKNVFFTMGDSREIGKYWGSDIGLLFIDGCHWVDPVLADFAVWTPWLIPEGIVALHDSTGFVREAKGVRPIRLYPSLNGYKSLIYEAGPEKAVQDAVESGEWEVVEEVDTTTFLKRAERRG